LKNCLPSCATLGKTPYELVNKSKPNLTLAHEFGTPVYVHVTTGGKLEAKAEEATFVGVDQESKGYRIWKTESLHRAECDIPADGTSNGKTD
jgi:hypothetical protein